MTPADAPLLVVVAGPNGAGKSTTAPRLLQEALGVSEFVNADAIALGLSAFRPESAAVAAGRAMLGRLRSLSLARQDFAFETTLAGRSLLPRIDRLREAGYHVHVVFLSLPSLELAVARVAERVAQGGHEVATEVVRRRFVAGLRNFFFLCDDGVDSWQVFDNSLPRGPRLIAARSAGEKQRVLDARAWGALVEQGR